MNNLIILQARTSSKRLPGKVLLPLNGRPMIEWQLKRISEANIGPIVLATSSNKSDDKLAELVTSLSFEVYRGSQDDVVDRFKNVVISKNPEYFVRLTGDCPLVMPEILSQMNKMYMAKRPDYFSNTLKSTFPDGLDIEFISTKAFLKMTRLELSKQEKEHVTLGIYQRPEKFDLINYESDQNLGNWRWTVDYPEDYAYVQDIYSHFIGRETKFTFEEVLKLVQTRSIKDNMISATFRNIALRNKESEL